MVNGRKSFHQNVARFAHPLDTLQVGHTEQDDAIAVYVSKGEYVMFWLLILLARCCCIAFLAGTSQLYWFIAHPYMTYYASLLGPQSAALLKPVGASFGAVAAVHVFDVAQMVYFSLTSRRFVFESPVAIRSTQVVPSNHDVPLVATSKIRRHVSSLILALHSRWMMLFDRRGFFGVESDYFHLRFLSRELVEIISQTWQAYNSSILIAKVWINNLYVLIVLINCISTPILQLLFRKRPAFERLLCLCCDLFLDAVMSMIVPLSIFMPYYHKFDVAMYNFEISYLYDDVWFANMVMENQQIFAMTPWDFFWTIIPHLSMYSCLSSLRALIRPHRSKHSSTTTTSRSTTRALCGPNDPIPQHSVVSEQTAAPSENESVLHQEEERPATVPVKMQHLTPPPLRRPKKRFRRRLITKGSTVFNIVNVIMVLWAFGILTLHLLAYRASKRARVVGCKQFTHPWFAVNVSCAVLQYNCHQYNSTDVRAEDLDVLQDESVVALVISHCPELHMPSQIRNFRNLLGIDIFNSTLHEWSVDAAITNATHPRLTYIIFVRVNMTQLPEGILQTLPLTMADFEIAVTNLTELPTDLHDRWGAMSLFYVEHSQLTEFPPTLMHLAVDDLSLIGSQIEQLPEFPPDHRGFFTLAMTHTPLVALPQSIGDLSVVGFLHLGYTQLREMPTWMSQLERTATKIFVHNTPFCAAKTTEERARRFGDAAVLTCTTTGDRQDGKYPLSLMLPRRPYEPIVNEDD